MRDDVDRKSRFPIRRFDGFDAMKAEEYAYWQGRPGHERLAAASQITSEAYGLKDARPPRLEKTLVHLQR